MCICDLAQVRQDEVGIIEKFGKFDAIAEPGCHPIWCPGCVYSMKGKVSTRVQQLDVTTDSKTKDNVTVTFQIAVQYAVINEPIATAKAHGAGFGGEGPEEADPDMDRDTDPLSTGHGVYRAFYKLEDIRKQLSPYIEDIVRSEIPKMTLDETYEKKENVAKAVESSLVKNMEKYGYKIISTLVTDLLPDSKVLAAMNNIETKRREREAATQAAEAQKIIIVKKAQGEGEAKVALAQGEREAMRLQGEGVALQRKAIVDGLKESVVQFNEGVLGTTPADIMQLMMVTQYTDMLKDVGGTAHSTVFVPNGASAVGDVQSQMRQGFMEANVMAQAQVQPIRADADDD